MPVAKKQSRKRDKPKKRTESKACTTNKNIKTKASKANRAKKRKSATPKCKPVERARKCTPHLSFSPCWYPQIPFVSVGDDTAAQVPVDPQMQPPVTVPDIPDKELVDDDTAAVDDTAEQVAVDLQLQPPVPVPDIPDKKPFGDDKGAQVHIDLQLQPPVTVGTVEHDVNLRIPVKEPVDDVAAAQVPIHPQVQPPVTVTDIPDKEAVDDDTVAVDDTAAQVPVHLQLQPPVTVGTVNHGRRVHFAEHVSRGDDAADDAAAQVHVHPLVVQHDGDSPLLDPAEQVAVDVRPDQQTPQKFANANDVLAELSFDDDSVVPTPIAFEDTPRTSDDNVHGGPLPEHESFDDLSADNANDEEPVDSASVAADAASASEGATADGNAGETGAAGSVGASRSDVEISERSAEEAGQDVDDEPAPLNNSEGVSEAQDNEEGNAPQPARLAIDEHKNRLLQNGLLHKIFVLIKSISTEGNNVHTDVAAAVDMAALQSKAGGHCESGDITYGEDTNDCGVSFFEMDGGFTLEKMVQWLVANGRYFGFIIVPAGKNSQQYQTDATNTLQTNIGTNEPFHLAIMYKENEHGAVTLISRFGRAHDVADAKFDGILHTTFPRIKDWDTQHFADVHWKSEIKPTFIGALRNAFRPKLASRKNFVNGEQRRHAVSYPPRPPQINTAARGRTALLRPSGMEMPAVVAAYYNDLIQTGKLRDLLRVLQGISNTVLNVYLYGIITVEDINATCDTEAVVRSKNTNQRLRRMSRCGVSWYETTGNRAEDLKTLPRQMFEKLSDLRQHKNRETFVGFVVTGNAMHTTVDAFRKFFVHQRRHNFALPERVHIVVIDPEKNWRGIISVISIHAGLTIETPDYHFDEHTTDEAQRFWEEHQKNVIHL